MAKNTYYSLNNLYDHFAIHYWCNACGDINVPDADPMYCGTPDEMPEKERDLYENYWSELYWANLYVVSMCGRAGMLIVYLIDYDMREDGSESDDDGSLFEYVNRCAESLVKSGGHPGSEILIGKDTDPIGHELCVFVPYEHREEIEYIVKELDEYVYPFIRAEIEEEMEGKNEQHEDE